MDKELSLCILNLTLTGISPCPSPKLTPAPNSSIPLCTPAAVPWRDLIRREATAGAVELVDGKLRQILPLSSSQKRNSIELTVRLMLRQGISLADVLFTEKTKTDLLKSGQAVYPALYENNC